MVNLAESLSATGGSITQGVLLLVQVAEHRKKVIIEDLVVMIQLVEKFGDEQLVLLLPDVDAPSMFLNQVYSKLVSLSCYNSIFNGDEFDQQKEGFEDAQGFIDRGWEEVISTE